MELNINVKIVNNTSEPLLTTSEIPTSNKVSIKVKYKSVEFDTKNSIFR